MKRIAIIIGLLVAACLPSYAQARVVDIQREADTLMFEFSSGIERNIIYKNQYGFFMREESDNMFDSAQKFYLGQDKEESIKSANRLLELLDEDVKTTARVIDAMGKEFNAVTDYGLGGYKRKMTKQKSNVLFLTTDQMAGFVTIRKKSLEELIVVLSKKQ